MNFDSFFRSRPQKIISVVVACGLYIVMYLQLEPRTGPSSAALGALPVALAGSLLGMWAGLITAGGLIVINTLLLNLMGRPGLLAMFESGGGPGMIVILLIALLVGRLFDMRERSANDQDSCRLAESSQRDQQSLADALSDAAATLNSTLNLDEVLDRILDTIGKVLEFEAATIMLVQGGYASPVRRLRQTGHDNLDLLRAMSFRIDKTPNLRRMVLTGQPDIIPDVKADDGWVDLQVTRWVGSHVGAPIKTASGDILGFITLDSPQAHYYTEHHANRLKIFTNYAASAIANARLHETVESRARRLELVAEVSRRSAAILDLNQLLDEAVSLISRSFGYYNNNIMLIEDDELVLQASNHSGIRKKPDSLRLKIGQQGITGQVAADGIPRMVPDVQADPMYFPVREAEETRSELAVPIKHGDQMIGVLDVQSSDLNAFADEDIHTLQTIATSLAVAIQNARLYEQIQQHASELENRVASRTAELLSVTERLTELDRLKSKFVADLSHEVRTPVTTLGLYLDLLAQGNPSRQSEYITILNEQVDRLKELIEGILDISRLDLEEQKQIKLGKVDLNETIAGVVKAHQAQAKVAGLSLQFDSDPDLPAVRGNGYHIAQLFMNLIVNAIRYTPEGAITITSTCDHVNHEAVVSVRDSGIGISEEDMPHLYERFYRGERVGQLAIPGSGLGLAIVKEIVDLHGGTITIESVVSEGTVVTITLPLAETQALHTGDDHEAAQ